MSRITHHESRIQMLFYSPMINCLVPGSRMTTEFMITDRDLLQEYAGSAKS